MRRLQNSNPGALTEDDLKYSEIGPLLEISTVGKTDEVAAGRWKSSSNWAVLKQNSRHCDRRYELSPSFFCMTILCTVLRPTFSKIHGVSTRSRRSVAKRAISSRGRARIVSDL